MAKFRSHIRIGNASGAIGDGLDQVYRLARDGNIDAITADYLAEFNIAWKAIEMIEKPDLGYEPHFLEQLAWQNGAAARLLAEKKIKVVHDGGALNPRGLAEKVSEYLRSQGLTSLKVAWVSGDDLTSQIQSGNGSYKHLDIPGKFQRGDDSRLLAANAYTGMTGIIAALEAGADIIICGRCCDASPVMALSSWWHNWKRTDYNKIAGSLMAGHLIECGAYTTGGNYCGASEIAHQYRVGYPIAEIYEDGSCVITKPDRSNGAVTIDTVKAQYLYEIQGAFYLNPDVIARLDGGHFQEIGTNRILLTGITGTAPPPTTKLAICLLGGYQAELSAYCTSPKVTEKVAMIKTQVLRELNPADFLTLSIEAYGSVAADPKSQKECTIQIRHFVQAKTKEAITKFKHAIFYNGMQGYCGLHLGMDWRTVEPRPFITYFPALIAQESIPLSVHFVGSDSVISVPARKSQDCSLWNGKQPSSETANPTSLSSFGPTKPTLLSELLFARSGDKGGNANIGFWARSSQIYAFAQSFLTIPRVVELLGDDWDPSYRIERFEVEGMWAVHFVVYGLLGEGVSSSAVLDGFGKSVGEFLRSRVCELPVGLVGEERERRRVAVQKAVDTREREGERSLL